MSESKRTKVPLAIVGIGCRFSGIAGPDAFWSLLNEGRHAFREIPDDRFPLSRYYDERPGTPGRVITREGSFIEDIRGFDASLFGISHREASLMDPQHRLLLEVAYMAFEDSGTAKEALAGSRGGVFVGLFTSDYRERMLKSPGFDFNVYSEIGGTRSSAAGRIAHAFDLRGPAVAVDTACASSLTAISLGAQGIWSGDLDLAIAGGSNIVLEPETSICFSRSGMLSPDSRCKFGDASANGFVRSDGIGLVVIKPLAQAIKDGDRIYATLEDIDSNNDARQGKGLYMTPSKEGQASLLTRIYDGVDRNKVVYVEAHGTGTRAGDPVELGSIGEIIGVHRSEETPLYVGSVKTNIGHTEGAAGVSGFIKCALSLYHRAVPPSLHLTEPNPDIPWDAHKIKIPTETVPLPKEGHILAGVSGFGLSGTNVHAILGATTLEPSPLVAPPQGPERLLPISAATPEALRDMVDDYRERLSSGQMVGRRLYDLCYSNARRRSHLPYRLGVVGASGEEMLEELGIQLESGANPNLGESPKVAFVFSGQGGQWKGMGRALIATEPVFRQVMAELDPIFEAQSGFSATEAMVSREGDWNIDSIQPLVFAVQVGLVRLMESFGITPQAVVGHSMGEVAAAVASGALSLTDGARVICQRSQALSRIVGMGEMAVVGLNLSDTEARLSDWEGKLSIAVSNSHRSTVVAGEPGAMAQFLGPLEAEGVFCRRVDVNVASHSPQTDPLLPILRASIQEIQAREGERPFHSTVEASIKPGLELGPDYWLTNLRQPVRFADTIQGMMSEGYNVFIEMGPHPVLTTAITQCAEGEGREVLSLGVMSRGAHHREELLGALTTLYTRGLDLDWSTLYPQGQWQPTPIYPFQREAFWYQDEEGEDQPTIGLRERPDGRPAHPFLPRFLELAEKGGGMIWELPLNVKAFPWLEDHKVRGSVIFPGAGYVEIALAVFEESAPGLIPHLEEIRFEEALVVPSRRPITLQVRKEIREDGRHALSFHSLDPESGVAQRHAWALLSLDEQGEDGPCLGKGSFLGELDLDIARRRLNNDHGFALLGLTVPAMAQEQGSLDEPFGKGLARIVRRGDHLLRVSAGRYALLLRGTMGEEVSFAQARVDAAAREALSVCGGGGLALTVQAAIPGEGDISAAGLLDALFTDLNGTQSATPRAALETKAVEDFYADMDSRGIHYGPAFRILKSLSMGDGAVEASLEASAPIAQELGAFLLHPALLDAAFQGGCAPALMGQGHETFMPVSIRRMRLLTPGSHALSCRGWIRGRRGDEIELDLVIIGPEGETVAEIDGFTIRSLPSQGSQLTTQAGSDWLYRWCWDEASLPHATETRHWQMGGSGGALMWMLGGALETRGHSCIPLGPGGTVDDGGSELLLVFGDTPKEEGGLKQAITMVNTLLRSLEAFEAPQGTSHPGLWIVTQGAKRVLDSDGPPNPIPAQLFALARVIASERPELKIRVIDMPEPWTKRDGAALINCLSAEIEDETAIRDGRVFLHRLRRLEASHTQPRRLRIPIEGNSPWVMKARAAGARYTLVLEPSQSQSPKSGDICIDVTALTLDPGVLLSGGIQGGLALMGTVEGIGSEVKGRRPGELVVGWMPPGSLKSGTILGRQICLPATAVVPLNPSAARTGLIGALGAHLPAYLALKRGGDLQPGSWVLIRGAKGALGWAAVRIAAAEGAKVIATAPHPAAGVALRGAGASHVLMERSGALVPTVMDLSSGHGVDLCLLLPGTTPNLEVLASGGRLVDLRGLQEPMVGLGGGAGLLSYVHLDMGEIATHGPALLGKALGEMLEGGFELVPPPGMRILGPKELEEALTRESSRDTVEVQLDDETLFGERSWRKTPLYREDGTYLITGGTGGLGIALAKRIAGGGGGSILLLSRRGVEPPEAEDIREMGAQVRVLPCDVTDPASLEAALSTAQAQGAAPLRGIYHLAAVLADGTLPAQTKERLQEAMAPKIAGALNLHRLSLAHPIEHFVLYSSAASVIGSPGQANYAAANAYLDALAEARQQRGLPALSLGWGTWGEIGLAAAEGNRGDRLSARGLHAMDPDIALDAMELALIETDSAQVGIFNMDWPRWAETMPRFRTYAPTLELVGTADEAPQLPFKDRMAQVGGEAQLGVILDELKSLAADVLRVPAPRLTIDRPLSQLGLDSLMTIELRGRVLDSIGTELSTAQLLGAQGLKEIALALKSSLGGEATALLPTEALPERPSLAEDIQAHTGAAQGEGILLTGGTGFLGAHLLSSLLKMEEGDIHCLVRCEDASHGLSRLKETAGSYGIDALPWERVQVIPGDLGSKDLGLSRPEFKALAERLGRIYHAGAYVNHILPYSQLEAANVQGTEAMLRLAAQGGSALHHVSTLGVLPFTTEGLPLPYSEATPIGEEAEPFFGGYAQSKWAAEALVEDARHRGIPVSIYRAGAITGSHHLGENPRHDLVWRAVESAIRGGVYPAVEGDIGLSPVDGVADAIVALSKAPTGQTFHVFRNEGISLKVVAEALKALQVPLKAVPLKEWMSHMAGPKGRNLPIAPFMEKLAPLDLRALAAAKRVLSEDTVAQLPEEVAERLQVGPELIKTYLKSLIRDIVSEGLRTKPSEKVAA